MKYKYLESYELSELIDYCRINAVKIVINHHNEDKGKIRYYRHLYYGFIYCKKVFSFIRKRNIRVTNVELYNFIKHQKNDNSTHRGIDSALYDVMNFLIDNF